jgi:hypothetical protein
MIKQLDAILSCYIKWALVMDLLLALFLGIYLLCYAEPKDTIAGDEMIQACDKIGDWVMNISLALAGFLLSIVAILITFKQFYFGQKETTAIKTDKKSFAKTESKHSQIFESKVYPEVIKVFFNSIIESSIIFITLIIIVGSTALFKSPKIIFLTIPCAILITLVLLRSLYIFKLFINAHSE